MKILLTYILLGISLSSLAQNDTCLVNSQIGISFPPVANAEQRDFAKLHLDSLGIKKIRFGEDWSFREPTQGEFNWSPLDDRINWAINNGYEVLLTIQSRGPSWACGLQNANSCVFIDNLFFKNYIDSLLSRYSNQIDKIQFGNEWQTNFWYIGSAEEFIASHNVLYNSVQEYSPTTEVVLGGFTTSSLRYLAYCNGYINHFIEDDGTIIDSTLIDDICDADFLIAGRERIDSVLANALYDIIDLHFYDDYEIWPELFSNFIDTLTTPILVSEFGGPNMNVEPYSEEYQADRTFKYIKTLDSLGIPEIYYFKLVEGTANPAHSTSGLIDDTTLHIKPVYDIVQSFVKCVVLGSDYLELDQFKMYPNPAKNILSFEYNNSELKNSEIFIYNSMGKLIIREKTNNFNNFVINTSKFQSGYYLVVVLSDKQKIYSNKLIIN